MFSGIKGIGFALLFVALLVFFFASGFFTSLVNGITTLKNYIGYLVFFFNDPIFSLFATLIGVLFFMLIVFAWKNTK